VSATVAASVVSPGRQLRHGDPQRLELFGRGAFRGSSCVLDLDDRANSHQLPVIQTFARLVER
jgi:hypothetical protein